MGDARSRLAGIIAVGLLAAATVVLLMQIRAQRPEATPPAPSIGTSAGESTVEPRPAPAAAEPRSARSPDSAPPSALVNAASTPQAANTSIAAQPLPAADTPLADILDELTRRADAGEPAAACRLAAELTRCSHRDELVSGLNAASLVEDRVRRPTDTLHGDRQRAALSTANRVCTGVAPERIAEAPHRLMNAADLGHPGARAWAAMHGHREAIRHLFDAPDVAQRWREQAVRWAIESLDTGNRSVGANWAGYAGFPHMDYEPIVRLLSEDPTLSLALLRYRALRAQRDGQPAPDDVMAAGIAAGLPPDAVALAESAAHRWVAAMGPQATPRDGPIEPAARLMAACDAP
jgi:hypothetical protein